MKQLILHLTDEKSLQVNCKIIDGANKQSPTTQNSIANIDLTFKNHAATLVLPGHSVTIITIKMPKLSRAKLENALPFALEDKLIEDINALHFTILNIDKNNNVTVAVIAKQKLRGYLDLFKTTGIKIIRIIPETLALPYSKPSIFELENYFIARTDKYNGFVFEKANLDLATEGKKYELINTTKNFLDYSLDYILENQKINLLHSELAGNKDLNKHKKTWQITAAIGAIAVALAFVNPLTSYFILKKQASTSEIAINKIYKKHFPKAKTIVAPKSRMQSKLKKLNNNATDNVMLHLLSITGNTVNKTHAVNLQQLDFKNKSLSLQVTAESFNKLDSFTANLKEQGLKVKQQNASSEKNKVKANIIISKGVA